MVDLEALKRAAEAATPGDLDTIPKPNSAYGGYDSGRYECPCCGGEGEVEGETFTNFDSVAIGVQFFGIGTEFGNYERYFRLANPATILDLISRLEEAEKALEPFSATGEALSSGPRDEAVWAGQQPAPPITFGDLRRAHAAHKRLKGGTDEG